MKLGELLKVERHEATVGARDVVLALGVWVLALVLVACASRCG